jgi:hypothetical protein
VHHRVHLVALVSTQPLEPQFVLSARLAQEARNTKQALVIQRLIQSAKIALLAQEISTSPLNAQSMLTQSAVHVRLAQRQSTGSRLALESQTLSAELARHAQQMSISRQIAVRRQIQFVQHALPALVDDTSNPLVLLLLIRFARRAQHAMEQLNTNLDLALLLQILYALRRTPMVLLHVLWVSTTTKQSLVALFVLLERLLYKAPKVSQIVQIVSLELSQIPKETSQLASIVLRVNTRLWALHRV